VVRSSRRSGVARPGSRYTRDFEDVTAWLAQQMAKTPIAGLLRVAWDTVGRIVERVVAEHLDERRLDGLVAIGVDEISYRRGQRYLTSVVDHKAGAIVWCAPGRNAQTLQAFFELLGERSRTIRAVSIDMSGGYEKAIHEHAPAAEVCFDPFHVVRLAQRAANQVRRDEWNAHERSHTKTGKWIKGTRWSLLKSPEQADVPRVPAQRGTPPALPAPGPLARPSAPRRVARLGVQIQARSSTRSSSSPARSDATAPASSPQSASECPTGDSKDSTAASD
jgi:transposase